MKINGLVDLFRFTGLAMNYIANWIILFFGSCISKDDAGSYHVEIQGSGTSGIIERGTKMHQGNIMVLRLLLLRDEAGFVVGNGSRAEGRLVKIVFHEVGAGTSGVIDNVGGQNVLLLVNVTEVKVLLILLVEC